MSGHESTATGGQRVAPRALNGIIKRTLVLGADAAACVMSVWGAFALRLDEFPNLDFGIAATSALALMTALPIFYLFGLYRAIYRHAGWSAMTNIAQAVLVSSLPVLAIVTMAGVPSVPRSIGVLQPLLFLFLVAGTRLLARALFGDDSRARRSGLDQLRVVIYGAGSAGRQLASALNSGSRMRVVAFLDDDERLQNRTLNQIPIRSAAHLDRLIAEMDVQSVLLALPSATRIRRNEIIQSLRDYPVHVQTLPDLSDLAHGRVRLTDLRELEIEDLLGRDPVAPNAILLGKNIFEKTVLVTGAGGSIGSELCRQILQIGPVTLLLVEASEFALYTIHQELTRRLADFEGVTPPTIVPLLASVRDRQRMSEIIGSWRPHTIYHAAAYKHVPLVEHNVSEGIRNNVMGTFVAADLARDFGVVDFVLISTDKAVRPTNVMGASKRLAEMILQAFATQHSQTRFSMVRFGNVLGSSGSVVPLFRQQIREGGPITITHRDITRYFMTIPEAAQLVIQAGAMAVGGEVFVLDMGEPVKIIDLARRMIELSGLSIRDQHQADGDISIVTVGLRPGEKLYEELLIGENPESTRHARILRAREHFVPWAQLGPQIEKLNLALDSGDIRTARSILQVQIPEYRPIDDVVDWVERQRALA